MHGCLRNKAYKL